MQNCSRYFSFKNCTIMGHADFQKCHWSASFSDCKFLKTVKFSGAKFFEGAAFKSVNFEQFVDFSDAVFEEQADFSNTHFNRAVTFRNAHFMKYFPKLDHTLLSSTALFTGSDKYWPEVADANAVESRNSAAVIRHSLGRQGFPEEEHYFFRKEMALAARIGSWSERLPYQAFGWFSNYGYSIKRPTIALLSTGTLGFFFFLYWLTWCDVSVTNTHPVFAAIGLSFSNLFGFFGFNRLYFGASFLAKMPPWIKFFAGTQTVLGFVFLFLLGLGLRNLFRLK